MEEQQTTRTKSSNKAQFLIAGFLLLVAAIGGYFVLGNNKKQDAMQMEQTVQPTQQAVPTAAETSMEDASGSAMSDTQGQDITVEGGDYYFKPNEIRVKKGEKVTITFTNAGGFHNFVVDEFNVKTKIIKDGEEETVTFTPDKAGTFEFYCSVGNHRAMGMKGKLIVE
jgi:plastocyanin